MCYNNKNIEVLHEILNDTSNILKWNKMKNVINENNLQALFISSDIQRAFFLVALSTDLLAQMVAMETTLICGFY